MSIIQAIILGIVQGITEFLPVSSSGHLAIIQNIFHIQTDGGLFFDVMLHPWYPGGDFRGLPQGHSAYDR